jgi:hypothetical protein
LQHHYNITEQDFFALARDQNIQKKKNAVVLYARGIVLTIELKVVLEM